MDYAPGTFTAFKRLGAVPMDISGLLIAFTQSGTNRRETHIQASPGSNNLRVLTTGSATSFTPVSLTCVPPTSTIALIKTLIQIAAGNYNAYFRASNLPVVLSIGWFIAPAISGTSSYCLVYMDTDGSQHRLHERHGQQAQHLRRCPGLRRKPPLMGT